MKSYTSIVGKLMLISVVLMLFIIGCTQTMFSNNNNKIDIILSHYPPTSTYDIHNFNKSDNSFDIVKK